MLASEAKMTMVKDQLKIESEAWNNKPRFGLFSYTASHGFGFRDDVNRKNHRDKTGRVQTAPKNFMAGRSSSNLPGLDAFTRTGYLSQNDEYVDPVTSIKYRVGDARKIKKVHAVAFRPSGNNPSGLRAPYEFINDPGRPKEAVLSPKGFFGFTPKHGKGNSTVGHLFSPVRYQTDPYESGKLMDQKERAEHAGKIINGPFNSTAPSKGFFTSDMQLFREPPGTSRPQKQTKSVSGLKPFLQSDPIKTGYNCTIGRFPEYIGQPEEEDVRGMRASLRSEGKWRDPYRELSVPNPSIQGYNATYRPRQKW